MTDSLSLPSENGVDATTQTSIPPPSVAISSVKGQAPAKLDASKLKVTLAKNLKPLPEPGVEFTGGIKTDHMLVMTFVPGHGWSAPEIKPYAPLELDPMSSCFQYATSSFEGMKAHIGPDGKPCLFRPKENMARLARSAERLTLPAFDQDALVELIKKLVMIESRWIPAEEGCSLYIRPTLLGTRPALGMKPSDYAMIYVVVTPWQRYFRNMSKGLSLWAAHEGVRAWPGGTGGHKLTCNYCPTFKAQSEALKRGYNDVLWLFGEGDEKLVTEAGVMNFFVVVRREDGGMDVITPVLDGTILPGITRQSCIMLIEASALPYVPRTEPVYVHEKQLFMRDLIQWSLQGRLLEAFGVGTAAVVAPTARIGYGEQDIILPEYEGLYGPVAKSLEKQILDIQRGKVEWEDWCVKCE